MARTLSDVFASWLASEMQKAAEEYSDTYTLDVLDSQGDPEKENSLLENCITQGYDCVIIQPNDGELQRPYAEKLVEAGIKVITTNAKIPDLEGASSVDADPYEQGAVLARDAAEKIPENGKIVILNCLPGNLHTTTRYKAFQEELLAKRPDIEVLGDQIIEQGSEADAMAVFEDWAQSYGTWDCTLTTSDALAQGFINMAKDNPAFENTRVWRRRHGWRNAQRNRRPADGNLPAERDRTRRTEYETGFTSSLRGKPSRKIMQSKRSSWIRATWMNTSRFILTTDSLRKAK